jgi:two-component system CheB/CheR fusion protein
MARAGLMLPLRAVINKAKKEGKTASKAAVSFERDGRTQTVSLSVIPLKNLREPCFLVVFEKPAKAAERASRAEPAALATPAVPGKGDARRMADLEAELVETREYLQSVREQQDAANEELQASNEEIQSSNEELQSMNEELETSQEELESANEELITVNEELASRNAELNRLNSDLTNLQTSAQQAIVLVGRDLRIRRFSALAESQFNLTPSDLGRRLGDIRHPLALSDLETFVTEAIDGVRAQEREVQSQEGRWYSLHAPLPDARQQSRRGGRRARRHRPAKTSAHAIAAARTTRKRSSRRPTTRADPER